MLKDLEAVIGYKFHNISLLQNALTHSSYVTNNHQEKNARILEKHGGARVILEKDATGEALYRAAGEILRSPELRRSMSAGMAELGIPDATERIYRTVMALRKYHPE